MVYNLFCKTPYKYYYKERPTRKFVKGDLGTQSSDSETFLQKKPKKEKLIYKKAKKRTMNNEIDGQEKKALTN